MEKHWADGVCQISTFRSSATFLTFCMQCKILVASKRRQKCHKQHNTIGIIPVLSFVFRIAFGCILNVLTRRSLTFFAFFPLQFSKREKICCRSFHILFSLHFTMKWHMKLILEMLILLLLNVLNFSYANGKMFLITFN